MAKLDPRPVLQDARTQLEDTEKIEHMQVIEQSLSNIDIKAVDINNSLFVKTECMQTSLRRSTIAVCTFESCDFIASDLSDGGIRATTFNHCRIGGLDVSTSNLQDLKFTDCKIDSLNMRMSKCRSIVFTDCLIQEIDIVSAETSNIKFVNCTIAKLQLTGAKLTKFDISGSQVDQIDGLAGARGLIINQNQLFQLSGDMATQLGIIVS